MQFDLPAEIERLCQIDTYQRGEPTGRTLVKEPDLRIVLMGLKAGARMREHRASGPISIHVLKGRATLNAAGQVVSLSENRLASLQPNIPHDVESIEDSVFLLTIGRTTYTEVSDRHEPHAP